MFLCWKHRDEKNRMATFDPATGKTQSPQACSSCRARKVKCIWDRGGCERCKTSGRECTFEANSRRKSKNEDRTSHAGTGNKRRTLKTIAGVDMATNQADKPTWPSSPTSSVSASGQNMNEHGHFSAMTAAVARIENPIMSSPSNDTDLLRMFSTIAQTNAESMFLISPTELDVTADGSFSLEKDRVPNITTGLETEEALMFDVLVTTPWEELGYASNTAHERQSSDSESCQCLHRLVVLVDEIESIVHRNHLGSLDSALAANKEALGCGAQMLNCIDCIRRVENMIILVLAVDKAVRMCSRVAEVCYAGLPTCRGGSSTKKHTTLETPLLLSLQTQLQSTGNDNTDQNYIRQDLDGNNNPSMRVYSIDTSDEYFFIIAGILRFQLLQLSSLTTQFRRVTAPLASETINQRLAACAGAVEDMLSKAGLSTAETANVEDMQNF
ncbi:hypothetical protein NUW58_g4971 [Xylaria curta]|uniref:Uncharacterized protein n=1 Tax=Xylaria curta TaxID=42375 RepID=A0ACC1P6N0_9PEZI|nr:hypothetical protein NUW58_g4971 [Xylaria curta]